MKHLVKWLLIASIFISVVLPQIDFELPDDSASFGILICDFQTGIFEEGSILNVPLCYHCDITEFPFDIDYQPPVDHGYIHFNYIETGDSVLNATIVWMGQGEITYPTNFTLSDSFTVKSGNSTSPDTMAYWYWYGTSLEDDTLLQSGVEAYENIRPLTIVHQFAEYPYQIVAYLYTPAVGSTDWTLAKWIFFLFRNPELIGIKNEGIIPSENVSISTVYPNPFNSATTIRFNVGDAYMHPLLLDIYNITGQLVDTLINKPLTSGEHEIVWNAGHLPSGVYFVRLQSGKFLQTRKIILMK